MSGPIDTPYISAEETKRLYRQLCAEQGISETPDPELVRDVQAIVAGAQAARRALPNMRSVESWSVEPHDLERIRRSLAMSPSLPRPVADELIAGLASIIDERRKILALAKEFERLAAELRALAS